MIPFCDTPAQSAVAAVLGGLLGGVLALALGLDLLPALVLAGVLGGLADLFAHVVRGDDQFRAALAEIRQVLGGRS